MLAASLILVSGCAAPKPPLPPPGAPDPVFPETGDPLREGDILLGRSYGLIGAMFARHGAEAGRYSHGAMIYRDAAGRLMMLNYRPTGMETCAVEDYMSRYNRLALVRYAGSLDDARGGDEQARAAGLTGAAALSAEAMRWLRINAKRRIPPDYHMDYDDPSAMFCLELAGTVYRNCGLPDPFGLAVTVADDPLYSRMREIFPTRAERISSPSAVLKSPDFVLVSEWLRPDYDLRTEILNETLAQCTVDALLEGDMPRWPTIRGQMKLGQILLLYRVYTLVAFWKPKQDFPDFIDARAACAAYTMYRCLAGTKTESAERMERETRPTFAADPDEETLAAVRTIVREAFAKRRQTYFATPGREDCCGLPAIPGHSEAPVVSRARRAGWK